MNTEAIALKCKATNLVRLTVVAIPYRYSETYQCGSVLAPRTCSRDVVLGMNITVRNGATEIGSCASTSCEWRVPRDAVLTLTGTTPGRWEGACASAGNAAECTLTMSEDKNAARYRLYS